MYVKLYSFSLSSMCSVILEPLTHYLSSWQHTLLEEIGQNSDDLGSNSQAGNLAKGLNLLSLIFSSVKWIVCYLVTKTVQLFVTP